jgi:hypothetical protein
LNDLSLELLNLYSQRTTISLKDLGAIYNTNAEDWCAPIAYLRDKKLIEIEPQYAILKGNDFTLHAPFRITYEGKCALEAELKSRRQISFNEFRAWITLIIAIAAFLLSIFSLYLQYK